MNITRQYKKTLFKSSEYNNTTDIIYVPFANIEYVKEDLSYIPKFSVNKKYHQIFNKFPVNTELKYSDDLIITAIQFGLVLLIAYKGAKDNFIEGHTRVIYPMILGKSKAGKGLLRAYHLKGWSVSKGANIEKEWRLFRTDRILSLSFIGQFFRMPPKGYDLTDSHMKGGVIKAANFNEIRNNQMRLVSNNVIQNKEEVEIKKIDSIVVDKTDSQLDLRHPFDNININEKDKNYIRLTFLKKVGSNIRIAVLGALGKPGNRVKVYSNEKYLGIYEVERSVMGNVLGTPNLQNISGYNIFDLYIFIRKK